MPSGRDLLVAQAEAVGLPLLTVEIPYPCSNAQYEAAMAAAMDRARGDGVTAVAFGDLFLEDVRRYREDRMRGTGLTPLFPIWGIPTDLLARDMVAAGLRARLTCIDPRKLPATLRGPRLRRDAAGRPGQPAPRRRSVRRARRVSLVRVRRADVQAGGADPRRRGVGAGRVRVRRPLARRPRASSGDPIRLRRNSHGRSGLPRDLSAG